MAALDPFYLALAVFAVIVFSTLITSACIKKIRNRRWTLNRRQPTLSDVTDENINSYDGPINIYEAKPHFEYDPDLLVTHSIYNNQF